MKGPDNQAVFGAPQLSLLTASQNVPFYIFNSDGRPLAKKYVWQAVRADDKFDNFGDLLKPQFSEDGPDGWKTWRNVDGAASGPALLQPQPGGNPDLPYFFIDFSAFAHVPAGETWVYLVRVIPMNDDGSIAGYPSMPMRVTYGKNPDPTNLTMPAPPPLPVLKPSDKSKPWSKTVGDPSLVSVDLNETFHNTQAQPNQSTDFSFSASASLLGVRETFMDVTAHAAITMAQGDNPNNPSIKGTYDANLKITLLGIDLCSDCSGSGTATYQTPGYGLAKDFKKEIDVSIPIAFNLERIDVSASAGFNGVLSIGTSFEAGGEGINFSFGPSVAAGVFLELAAGIGIGGFDVVQVGVEGSVDLIDFGLVVALDNDGFSGQISQFTTLNGSLSAFVKVSNLSILRRMGLGNL